MTDASYFAIFDQEPVNIYNANNTTVTVSRGAILRGWIDKENKSLWRIPLVKTGVPINNLSTQTVMVDKPPSEFLTNHLPLSEAIFSAYELNNKPELIRYYHAAAGFLPKPTWLKAIKRGFYASWIGLAYEAANKYFPQSSEENKEHGRKIPSGLRSTQKSKKEINEEAEHDIIEQPQKKMRAI